MPTSPTCKPGTGTAILACWSIDQAVIRHVDASDWLIFGPRQALDRETWSDLVEDRRIRLVDAALGAATGQLSVDSYEPACLTSASKLITGAAHVLPDLVDRGVREVDTISFEEAVRWAESSASRSVTIVVDMIGDLGGLLGAMSATLETAKVQISILCRVPHRALHKKGALASSIDALGEKLGGEVSCPSVAHTSFGKWVRIDLPGKAEAAGVGVQPPGLGTSQSLSIETAAGFLESMRAVLNNPVRDARETPEIAVDEAMSDKIESLESDLLQAQSLAAKAQSEFSGLQAKCAERADRIAKLEALLEQVLETAVFEDLPINKPSDAGAVGQSDNA